MILSKSRLTNKDTKRLESLEDEIDKLPTGQTREEIEAMELIKEAAKQIKINRDKDK